MTTNAACPSRMMRSSVWPLASVASLLKSATEFTSWWLMLSITSPCARYCAAGPSPPEFLRCSCWAPQRVGHNARHDLLCVLIKNDVLARRCLAEIIDAASCCLHVLHCFHPNQAPVIQLSHHIDQVNLHGSSFRVPGPFLRVFEDIVSALNSFSTRRPFDLAGTTRHFGGVIPPKALRRP